MKNTFNKLSEETFLEIYHTMWQKLYTIGYTFVRDKDTARTLVQDVFVNLWNKRNELDEKFEPEIFLLECLKTRIYDHLDSKSIEGRKTDTTENFANETRRLDALAFLITHK